MYMYLYGINQKYIYIYIYVYVIKYVVCVQCAVCCLMSLSLSDFYRELPWLIH